MRIRIPEQRVNPAAPGMQWPPWVHPPAPPTPAPPAPQPDPNALPDAPSAQLQFDFNYRPPAWKFPADVREQLRGLVQESMSDLEPTLVTHGRADTLLMKLAGGFRIDERTRAQLDAYHEIKPGEDGAGLAFASIEFRPKTSTDRPIGIERYGDVVLHWDPKAINTATITPIISGQLEWTKQYGAGLQAGTAVDLVDIVTDTLIAHNSDVPAEMGRADTLPKLVAQPHDDALRGVEMLMQSKAWHDLTPEVILRGVKPEWVRAVTILGGADSQNVDQMRAWAASRGLPVIDRPSSEQLASVAAQAT